MKICKGFTSFQVVILALFFLTHTVHCAAQSTSPDKYTLRHQDRAFDPTTFLTSDITLDEFLATLEEQSQQSRATSTEGAGMTTLEGIDNPSDALTLIDYFQDNLSVTLHAPAQGYHTLYALCTGAHCPDSALKISNQSGFAQSVSLSPGVVQTTLTANGLTTLAITDSNGNPIVTNPVDVLGVCITNDTPLLNVGPTPTNFTVLDGIINALLNGNGNPALIGLLGENHYLPTVYSVGGASVGLGTNSPFLKSRLSGIIVCSLGAIIGSLTEYVILVQTLAPTTTAVSALKPISPMTASTAFAFPAAGQGDYPETSQSRIVATAFPNKVSSNFQEILASSSLTSIPLEIIQPFTQADTSTGGCSPEPNIAALSAVARTTVYLTTQQPYIGVQSAFSALVNNRNVPNTSYPFITGCGTASMSGEFSLNKDFLTTNSDLWLALTYDPATTLPDTFRIPAIGDVIPGGAAIFLGNFLRGLLTTGDVDTVAAMPFLQKVLFQLENL